MPTADLQTDLSHALSPVLGADAVWRTWRCPRCGADSTQREGCAACIRQDLAKLLGLNDGMRDAWIQSDERARYHDADELVPSLVRGVRDFPNWHPEWSLAPHAPVNWEAPEILVPRWAQWVSVTGGDVTITHRWTPDGVHVTLAIDSRVTEAQGSALTATWAVAWLGTFGPGNAQ